MKDLSNRDNFMAICFSQAFILYSWPRQQKLQQFDRMKEIVRKLIAADFVTVEATAAGFSVAVAGAGPAAEATVVASTNPELLLSIKELVLDIRSIEINAQLPEPQLHRSPLLFRWIVFRKQLLKMYKQFQRRISMRIFYSLSKCS
jgi:hypothetical protein